MKRQIAFLDIFNYDKEVIEPIDVNSIQQENNTVKIGNQTLPVEDLTDADINEVSTSSAYVAFNGNPDSDNDTRILIDFEQAITEDTDLITIDFKVKEDATLGEIKNAITYSLFVVTANSEESEEITKNVTLTVNPITNNDDDDNNDEPGVENENKNTNSNTNTDEKDKNTNKNTNTNTNKNTNSNTNTNKNANTNKNVNDNKDNTLVGAALPATGARMIIVPAIILIILSYVCYNRYMKYKDI